MVIFIFRHFCCLKPTKKFERRIHDDQIPRSKHLRRSISSIHSAPVIATVYREPTLPNIFAYDDLQTPYSSNHRHTVSGADFLLENLHNKQYVRQSMYRPPPGILYEDPTFFSDKEEHQKKRRTRSANMEAGHFDAHSSAQIRAHPYNYHKISDFLPPSEHEKENDC